MEAAHAGRVVVVTGAASGIGRAVAELVVAEGGAVVALDREAVEWPGGTDVIAFLLSPAASFVTGVAVAVDGGVTASTGQFLPRQLEGAQP